MARRARNITRELLSISDTVETKESNKTKRNAWAIATGDMMDKNLTLLLALYPNFDTALVQGVLENHDGDLDRAADSLLEMTSVARGIAPNKTQAPTSFGTAQTPIFMRPVRSNTSAAARLTQTTSENVKQATTKKHVLPEAPSKVDEDASAACSEWFVSKSRKKKPSSPKPSADIQEQGKTLRQKARARDSEHRRLLSAATSLRHKGQPAQSNALLLQAEQAKADRDALNQRAALALFAEQNPHIDRALSVDLHFLAEHEALALLSRHLPRLAAAARREGERWVQVVAGAGTHSAGGRGVLEPAVEDWLRCKGIAVRRGDPGVLWAQAADVLRDA